MTEFAVHIMRNGRGRSPAGHEQASTLVPGKTWNCHCLFAVKLAIHLDILLDSRPGRL
jgi:hypothetical protein